MVRSIYHTQQICSTLSASYPLLWYRVIVAKIEEFALNIYIISARANGECEIKEAGATAGHKFRCMTSLESKLLLFFLLLLSVIIICSCSSRAIRVIRR